MESNEQEKAWPGPWHLLGQSGRVDASQGGETSFEGLKEGVGVGVGPPQSFGDIMR